MEPVALSRVRLRAVAEPRPRRDVGPPFQKLVGGWLCLDFLNTVTAWVPVVPGADHGDDDRPLGEKLTAYADLLRWAEQAGALGASDASAFEDAAAHHPDRAEAVLGRALHLRGALYRLFNAYLGGRALRRDDLEVLEERIALLRRGERLAQGDDGTVELVWTGGGGDLDGVLWPVLRSAVALLSSRPALDRLRQCDGERCGWLFVDVSRGGRRRWCDMADCGNVAKVRAHRAKNRARRV